MESGCCAARGRRSSRLCRARRAAARRSMPAARPAAEFRRRARRPQGQSVRRGARLSRRGARRPAGSAAIAAYSAGSRRPARQPCCATWRSPSCAAVADGAALARCRKRRVGLAILPLEQGFATDGLVVLSEQDILGDRLARAPRRAPQLDNFITEAASLAAGRSRRPCRAWHRPLRGLETLDVAGAPHDCLRVHYAGDDRLYRPGREHRGAVALRLARRRRRSSTGSAASRWQSRKARVKQRIREIAGELIRVAAERAAAPGETLRRPRASTRSSRARFPYPETEDQLRAIEEMLGDMASGKPMDRLICGDVGFGKTEVALRAAFVAAMAGAQVAVIVPTTLLARQHFRSFSERFAGLAGARRAALAARRTPRRRRRPRRSSPRAGSTSSSAPTRCSRRTSRSSISAWSSSTRSSISASRRRNS